MAFFYNARFTFDIDETPEPIPGTIIAASSVSAVDFIKGKRAKDLARLKHLKHRYLDPQLYMAGLDPALEPKTVERLASYPWFHGQDIPKYDSGEYKNPTQWKQKHAGDLLGRWTRKVPSGSAAVRKAAHGAVQLQLSIGCCAVILPGPLTTITDQSFERELEWMDAGIEAAAELKANLPLYATVAISEAVLHNVAPVDNPLIHAISNQISSRKELAGAYVVFEQSEPGSYVWKAHDPLLCLMILTDDLHRGSKKDVIVNYLGSFGSVATAAGVSGWASGFNQSQRRFSLRATQGRARPRYYSIALAGDIGVEDDLKRIHDRGLSSQLLTPTQADARLRQALASGQTPAAVPEWQYRNGNTGAAKSHYMEAQARLGAYLHALPPDKRVEEIQNWLVNAQNLASQLAKIGFNGSGPTDVVHQRVWLEVLEKWRAYAKQ
jgi:hypothetical protein